MASLVLLIPLLVLAACRPPHPRPEDDPAPAAAKGPSDPVVERAGRALGGGDLATARRILERERWHARDRARAALLYFDCMLAAGQTTDAIEALRAYLEKTARPSPGRDAVAARLLRNHALGGGLAARTAEEALHFGLYALFALQERENALPDLERAAAGAPEPERSIARRFLGEAR
ncbi:MAG: hypothetical protein ACT4PV_09865 [Planctomycetaceae bacterium]